MLKTQSDRNHSFNAFSTSFTHRSIRFDVFSWYHEFYLGQVNFNIFFYFSKKI